MSKYNGGPAFPRDSALQSTGMTLRDYFAAKAMQGILSDRSTVSAFDEASAREFVQPACLVATASYAIADAMLAERAK